ncbi:morphogenic membrane protein MmpB [Streptomyces carpaticus]|uniref:Morphogenic membrane protein MmpB n=1 Tax=Streptomyces carpaticus TaxID=285558 RepID=A0ABV4ZPA8_9ACTN
MLWSDMRREEPSREARTTRAMLRRVGWVIALAGMIGTSLVMLAQPPA